MAVSKRKRFETFKRDGFVCQYCGRTPPGVVLEIDHILATSKGGTDESLNLITSCFDCNRGKSDVDLAIAPETLQRRLEVQREATAQLKAYHKHVEQVRAEEDDQLHKMGTYWCNRVGNGKERDKWRWGEAREASGRLFLRNLGLSKMYDSIDIALGRGPSGALHNDEKLWRYFCGICGEGSRSLTNEARRPFSSENQASLPTS